MSNVYTLALKLVTDTDECATVTATVGHWAVVARGRPKRQACSIGKSYPSAVALKPTDLVAPTSGSLSVDGRDRTFTPANRRNLGVVFRQ